MKSEVWHRPIGHGCLYKPADPSHPHCPLLSRLSPRHLFPRWPWPPPPPLPAVVHSPWRWSYCRQWHCCCWQVWWRVTRRCSRAGRARRREACRSATGRCLRRGGRRTWCPGWRWRRRWRSWATRRPGLEGWACRSTSGGRRGCTGSPTGATACASTAPCEGSPASRRCCSRPPRSTRGSGTASAGYVFYTQHLTNNYVYVIRVYMKCNARRVHAWHIQTFFLETKEAIIWLADYFEDYARKCIPSKIPLHQCKYVAVALHRQRHMFNTKNFAGPTIPVTVRLRQVGSHNPASGFATTIVEDLAKLVDHEFWLNITFTTFKKLGLNTACFS